MDLLTELRGIKSVTKLVLVLVKIKQNMSYFMQA